MVATAVARFRRAGSRAWCRGAGGPRARRRRALAALASTSSIGLPFLSERRRTRRAFPSQSGEDPRFDIPTAKLCYARTTTAASRAWTPTRLHNSGRFGANSVVSRSRSAAGLAPQRCLEAAALFGRARHAQPPRRRRRADLDGRLRRPESGPCRQPRPRRRRASIEDSARSRRPTPPSASPSRARQGGPSRVGPGGRRLGVAAAARREHLPARAPSLHPDTSSTRSSGGASPTAHGRQRAHRGAALDRVLGQRLSGGPVDLLEHVDHV